MSPHTPTPWTVGRVLKTATTKRWNAEDIASAEAIECRMVFARFSESDEGRSRLAVATCPESPDATFIVTACNAHDALLAALDKIEEYTRACLHPVDMEIHGWARAALALARPTQDSLGATPRRREEQEPR